MTVLQATSCPGCSDPTRPPHFHSETEIAVSSSDGVTWYTCVISCNCKGGENGAVCKHLETAASLKRETKSEHMKEAARARKERMQAGGPSRKNPAIAAPDGDTEFWGSSGPNYPDPTPPRPTEDTDPGDETPELTKIYSIQMGKGRGAKW